VKVLLQVLFYAAGHRCSVFAACREVRTAPSDQAVRDALTALCPAHKDRAGDSCLAIVGKSDLGYFMRQSCICGLAIATVILERYTGKVEDMSKLSRKSLRANHLLPALE
jgi:hypothetical protein